MGCFGRFGSSCRSFRTHVSPCPVLDRKQRADWSSRILPHSACSTGALSPAAEDRRRERRGKDRTFWCFDYTIANFEGSRLNLQRAGKMNSFFSLIRIWPNFKGGKSPATGKSRVLFLREPQAGNPRRGRHKWAMSAERRSEVVRGKRRAQRARPRVFRRFGVEFLQAVGHFLDQSCTDSATFGYWTENHPFRCSSSALVPCSEARGVPSKARKCRPFSAEKIDRITEKYHHRWHRS
mgnify:CR=1 FL=1